MEHFTICLYGAASNAIDPIYISETEALGREIARRGHTLVFGGGASGMMGASARGVSEEGGKLIGVVPTFMHEFEDLYENCTELVQTATMAERKQIMEARADAFLITPGGVGTMDEFFQILTLVELRRKKAPIVIYNINHYYDKLLAFMEDSIAAGFIRADLRDEYAVAADPVRALNFIEENAANLCEK